MSFLLLPEAQHFRVFAAQGMYGIYHVRESSTRPLKEKWNWGKTLEEDKRILAEVNKRAIDLAKKENCRAIPLGLCKDTYEKYNFPIPYHTWVWLMAHHFEPWKYWESWFGKSCPDGVLGWESLEKRCRAVCEGFRLEWHHFDTSSFTHLSEKDIYNYRLQFEAWRQA